MKKNKKGFTLAELLIVVAIIAVLTAIAVPLFVTSLNKAKANVKDANIRAVRIAAVAHILAADEPTGAGENGKADENEIWTYSTANGWELKGPWKVVAEINASGDITKITIQYSESSKSTESKCEEKGSGYEVTCIVTLTDVTAYQAPGVGG